MSTTGLEFQTDFLPLLEKMGPDTEEPSDGSGEILQRMTPLDRQEPGLEQQPLPRTSSAASSSPNMDMQFSIEEDRISLLKAACRDPNYLNECIKVLERYEREKGRHPRLSYHRQCLEFQGRALALMEEFSDISMAQKSAFSPQERERLNYWFQIYQNARTHEPEARSLMIERLCWEFPDKKHALQEEWEKHRRTRCYFERYRDLEMSWKRQKKILMAQILASIEVSRMDRIVNSLCDRILTRRVRNKKRKSVSVSKLRRNVQIS